MCSSVETVNDLKFFRTRSAHLSTPSTEIVGNKETVTSRIDIATKKNEYFILQWSLKR